MGIKLTGRHIDISESFKKSVNESINELIAKYKLHPIEISATIEKQGGDFISHIHGIISKGIELYAEGNNEDAYLSMNDAIEKLKKRILKYKNHHDDHHR